MKHDPIASGKRKSVNVSLDTGVVAYARSAGVNLSQVSEMALRRAARAAIDAQWEQDNQDWIIQHRQWAEENELPLEKYRLF